MSNESVEGDATLTPEQRDRFTRAADAALRVRRNILLLAAHASGHRKHPHGKSCEECKERWPCVAVMRAAGPALNAVADLPSISTPREPPCLGGRWITICDACGNLATCHRLPPGPDVVLRPGEGRPA